jgi:intracellular sulfur oxidation DsrE/DsrF family protein
MKPLMYVTRISIHSKKKHRIILIGDSNIKGYMCNLKSLLSSNYELYSVVKPGSSTSELKETAKEEVSQLSHDDLIIIICSSSNDYELKEFSLTLQNITNFIKSNNHTNIVLTNVQLTYD